MPFVILLWDIDLRYHAPMADWTIGTLKEYVDQRFSDLQQRTSDAKHSMDRAEDAASETRKYAELKSNEFRAQLSDQAAMFMPRAEADQRYATTTDSIKEQRITATNAIDEIRRLVYIATGIALAAAIAIPMLLRAA